MAAARGGLLSCDCGIGPQDWRRFVPYGSRTLHDLLAHLAAADQTWALAAGDLLKGEPAREAALAGGAAGRGAARRSPADERSGARRCSTRWRGGGELLLGLYELLEPRHLALSLRAFGDEHNSVREHIWLGYHDRLHAADIRRALRLQWYPPKLRFLPDVRRRSTRCRRTRRCYVVFSVIRCAGSRHRRRRLERTGSCSRISPRAIGCSSITCARSSGRPRRALAGHRRRQRRAAAGAAFSTRQRRSSRSILSMRHETLLLHVAAQAEAPRAGGSASGGRRSRTSTRCSSTCCTSRAHERSHREQLRRAMAYLR